MEYKVYVKTNEQNEITDIMTAGTLQPKPISSGTMLRPVRPIFRISLSMMKATRAV